MGIEAGLAWRPVADASVFYIDRGMSGGMNAARLKAMQAGSKIIFRSLDPLKQAHLHDDPDPQVFSNGKVTTVRTHPMQKPGDMPRAHGVGGSAPR